MSFGRKPPLRENDGAPAGAGGAPPPAPAAPPAAPPAPPPVDAKALEASARAKALADLGFADEAAYKAHLDAKKKAEDAALSERDREKKALNEALDGRGKAESDAEKAKAEAKSLREQIALRDSFDAQGVTPKERIVVEALYRHAKEAGNFDEKTFFEELRKERPYLFGAAAPTAPAAPSTPGAPPPAAASPFGGVVPGQAPAFDALTLTPEQRRAARYSRS